MVATTGVLDSNGTSSSPGIGSAAKRRRGTAAFVVAAVIFAASLSALTFMHRAHAHARVFPPTQAEPNVIGVASVNEQYQVGFWLERPELEIDGVTPIVTANSSSAAIGVTVCKGARGPSFGAAPGSLAGACDSLESPHGIRLGANDYVVVTVVPLKPGVINVHGIRVSVRDGSRRWSEDTGQYVRLRVR